MRGPARIQDFCSVFGLSTFQQNLRSEQGSFRPVVQQVAFEQVSLHQLIGKIHPARPISNAGGFLRTVFTYQHPIHSHSHRIYQGTPPTLGDAEVNPYFSHRWVHPRGSSHRGTEDEIEALRIQVVGLGFQEGGSKRISRGV